MGRKWTDEEKAAARERAIAQRAAAATAREEGVVDLSTVLAEMRAIRQENERSAAEMNDRLESQRLENQVLRQQLAQAAAGKMVDEYGIEVDAAPPNDGSAAYTNDRPATLQEALDAAELQARVTGDRHFDRDRVRRILLGEPVEDLNALHCPRCGKTNERWTTQEDVDEHFAKHAQEKQSAYRR